MEEEIRRIAKENLANRKKVGISVSLTIVFTLGFMIASMESQFQKPIWWILMIMSFVLGMFTIKHYGNKIIGKKSALDIEVERLKALHPEEKLELPVIDDAELKLKEMIRRSNRDDMI